MKCVAVDRSSSVLKGFRFKNHYCSCIRISLKGCEDQIQTMFLTDKPHTLDQSEDWFELNLDDSIFSIDKRTDQDLVFVFTLVQSSPLWQHKVKDIENVTPVYFPPPPDASSSTVKLEDNRMERLQKAVYQLHTHLSALESLSLSKSKTRSKLTS